MQYALNCKLAENNNELLPKSFQVFLSRGAGDEESVLIKVITKY